MRNLLFATLLLVFCASSAQADPPTPIPLPDSAMHLYSPATDKRFGLQNWQRKFMSVPPRGPYLLPLPNFTNIASYPKPRRYRSFSRRATSFYQLFTERG